MPSAPPTSTPESLPPAADAIDAAPPAGSASAASASPPSAPPAASTIGAETKRFGRSALVYLVPSLLVRGISFLLTPLYTRAMGPGDYAIVAVANSVVAVLGIVFGLALYGCIPRLFFEYEGKKQREFFGTLLLLSIGVPLLFLAVLFPLGAHGYLDVFETVRFRPHLELALWTSFFGVFMPLPISVYNAREQPGKVAALSMASALAQLALTLVFVSVLHQGALGVLRANLLSTAIVGGLSALLMLRMSTVRASLPGAREALVYSVPIVPHLVANWALSISDRLILDKYVPAADVGRYSLGYMFGMIVTLVASSAGQALAPMANRQLKDPELAKNVPPLGTYTLLVTVVFALGIALTARELLAIIAPRSYESAIAIVPWVVLGAVFQGVYLVWSVGTWFSMRTKLVPLVTLASAAINIVINLIYVPRFGMMAAAVSTTIAYAASALLHGALAQKLHPIPWEYRRWISMLVLAVACYAAGEMLPLTGILLPLVAKTILAGVLYPVSLLLTGFFTKGERDRARGFFARKMHGSGRS